MVESVNARLGALFCLTLAVVVLPARAGLPDPTRPPGASEFNASVAGSGPVLQSILISGRRKEATIDGQTVKVGNSVGDARVIRITETEVHLRRGQDVERLTLFPGVQKKPAPSRMPAGTRGANP